MNIRFKPIKNVPSGAKSMSVKTRGGGIMKLAKRLEQEYDVTGPATHFAITEYDEVCVAFPTYYGRLILVCRSTDDDQGVEYEMDEDEIAEADNGDGTFTLTARPSLV